LCDLERDGRTDVGLVSHGSGNTALLYLLGPNGTFQPGPARAGPLAVSHRRLAAAAPRAERPIVELLAPSERDTVPLDGAPSWGIG